VNQVSDRPPVEAALAGSAGLPQATVSATVIYVVAFVTGGIVMSFEMLGSRYLNPYFGSGIHTWAALGAAGLVCRLILMALPRVERRRPAVVMLITTLAACAAFAIPAARAEPLFDESVRAAILKRPDGRLAHVESEYNDIYITKRRGELTMSFQLKGWDYTESVADLRDPDALPLRYSQIMSIATIYPEEPKKILMLGLGGGSISTYLGRFMPEVEIDTVEIDRRVIEVAKQYFGLRETKRVRYLDGDGRVFLNRNKGLYDLILLDAYRGGFVPFHLLTTQFYTLVKQRLTPGGAVASNIHDGTKLYHSTVRTLGDAFPGLDLYPSGVGEVIALATLRPLPDKQALAARAAALQERYNFRYPLPEVLKRRMENPQSQAARGDLITDDFAPVNLYDTIGRERARRK
jgi:spermidine synthase